MELDNLTDDGGDGMSWHYVPPGLSPAFYALDGDGYDLTVHDTADLVTPGEVVDAERFGWLISRDCLPVAEGFASSAEVAQRHAEWALADILEVVA